MQAAVWGNRALQLADSSLGHRDRLAPVGLYVVDGPSLPILLAGSTLVYLVAFVLWHHARLRRLALHTGLAALGLSILLFTHTLGG